MAVNKRVLITTVQVPFVHGGAELLANGLLRAFVERGFEAEIVTVPFKWYPPEALLDQMLACRLFDIREVNGEPVDLVVGLKFPAYFIPHPGKVLWILHQHRPAYDQWDSGDSDLAHYPNGEAVRDAIRQADRNLLGEASGIFCISSNVAARLKHYSDVAGKPLYHPPPYTTHFHCGEDGGYFYFPSRIDRVKRQKLVIDALAHCSANIRMVFSGRPFQDAFLDELLAGAAKLGVADRVEFIGQVSERKKYELYANATAIVYTPRDEDYGYVTLEAMLSSKAMVTCRDSGGVLEFVEDGHQGLVVEPTPEALGAALDRIWHHRADALSLGQAGRAKYEGMNITWDNVIERLTNAA